MTRLTILRAPCDECPFKGRFDLRPGRLRDIMEQCRRDDSPFVCHKTCEPGGEVSPVWTPGVGVCAGWLEAADQQPYGPPTVIQIARRLNLTEEVPPP